MSNVESGSTLLTSLLILATMSLRSLFLLPFLLMQPVGAQDDGGDERLGGAIRLIFRSRGEPAMRDGARECLRVGDAKAMAILLKALEGPNPHMRDIVWEVMPEFQDPYARRRVADELKNNKGNAGVRHWCAELLGMYGDADWLPYLATALRDKDLDVVRAATRSLGMLRHRDATKPLGTMTKHKDPRVRANAIEALARIDSAEFGALLRTGLTDDDGGVRCALLGAASEILPAAVEALSRAALSDDDWRPRMQAVDNLGRLETPGAVEALILGLQDGRPAVRVRVLGYLQAMTQQRYTKTIEWDAWWKDNAATFAFVGGKAKASATATASTETVASFHGVRIESDHCVFLLDRTPSMEQPLASAGVNKQEAAVVELEAALARLVDTDLAFNVAAYNEKVETLAKTAVPLTKRSLAAALKFVRAGKLKGSKDIWHALTTVVTDPSVDTVVLLSSGEPEVGDYVHWNRVTRHLADLNRFHKIVVHTVAYSNVEWYLEQLRHISEVTGGMCKEVN